MKKTFYVIEVARGIFHRRFEGGNYGTTDSILDAARYSSAEATEGTMWFNYGNCRTARARKVTVHVTVTDAA